MILKYPPSYGVPAAVSFTLLEVVIRCIRVFGSTPSWRSGDQCSVGNQTLARHVWLPNTSVENAALTRALHPSLDGGDVVLIDDDTDALGRLGAEGNELARDEAEGLRCERLG